MHRFMLLHNRIKSIVKDEEGGSDEPGTGMVEKEEGATPKGLTQEQVNAIIDRRLAKEREKLETTQKELDKQRQLNADGEQRLKEAEEKGFLRGQLEAKRKTIADQYGISINLLPDTEEQLDQFAKEMNATINSKRKVLPVTVEKKTSAPDWMGNVHA